MKTPDCHLISRVRRLRSQVPPGIPLLAGCLLVLLVFALPGGFADAATLASISPTSRTAGGAAFTLTVNGTGFTTGSVVQWNGAGRTTTFVSAIRVRAAIPATDIATAGTAQVTVVTGGVSSNPLTLTINNPAPTNSSLAPTSTIAGGPAFTLTVTGTNFVRTSVVQWNAVARPTTYVSATQLQATIGAADVATAGTASVRVFNPTPGGGTSGARTFTISNPVPATTGITPASATPGGSAFTLTVTGTNFVTTSVVRWNGSNRTTTYVSSTQLTAAITASDIATAGTPLVTVFNPTPGGGTSNAQTFTIGASNPVPTTTGITPGSAIAGGSAFTLTVTGTNFVNGSTVSWNAATRSTTFVSTTQLTAAITASDIAAAGTAAVTVVTPAPGGGTSNPQAFTITPDTTPPTVTGQTPINAATGVATNTTVTARFSEAINVGTLTTGTFTLRVGTGSPLGATVTYNSTTFTATLTPSAPLAPNTLYTATVVGGAGGVTDLAGNALAANVPWTFTTGTATGSCGTAANPILCENAQAGNPPSEWDISGAGDTSIQGFATDISVNRGSTVHFKLDTNATGYRLDIYRIGYYGGNGARKVATVSPSVSLPQNQPACRNDGTTGLIDCGNWAESAAWAVPTDAVSGIYIARAVRSDTGGASHIVFIVRDDASHADLLFQTSDTTWQAYNDYGGNSLYVGGSSTCGSRACKVSYNRPFNTRGDSTHDWLFNAEYPMVRWLEANGYNVSYTSGVDSDRLGATILQHRVFLSVGHDEYWSGGQRANVEAARAAGVNLAFFSGNEIFWKTRWEPSIDGTSTPYRTLVTYKETHANAVIDPADPPTWTGTWRDPRFSPPADGGRPENALSGTIFQVNDSGTSYAITVPQAYSALRFWRNTSIATLPSGGTATLAANTLGYEWDVAPDNGAQPPGLIRLSRTTLSVPSVLLDYGSTYGAGTATHNLTLYRHSSGALVFGAGTIQWPWGLDAQHDTGTSTADARMQQATVNLFADMGVQPASLQAGLVAAAASTDTVAPSSTITSPTGGAALPVGVPVTITGTASDTGGGVVGAVEVSVDGGATWHAATGGTSWTYAWTPAANGTATIRSRAVDDSGNLETPTAGVTVTVGTGSGGSTCPCTIWPSTATPTVASDADTSAVELGVKFRASVSGSITGVRFYKGTANTGTHVGNLWTSTGTLLASVTFTGETGSGWQQATFASPVAITANTTYVASYHTNVGHYAGDNSFFASAGVTNGPLTALANGADGGNGVYVYGASSAFPNQTFQASNYWVDVVFTTSGGAPDTTPPTVTSRIPAPGATGIATTTAVTVIFSEALNASTVTSGTVTLQAGTNPPLAAAVSYNSSTFTATLTPSSPLAGNTLYTATVMGGPSGVKDVAGNSLTNSVTWTFTTAAPDTTPPTVTGQTPASNATGVPVSTPVTATFSEAMATSTLTASTFTLTTGSTTLPATVSYNPTTFTATLTPSSPLAAGTLYTATVVGGASGVKDLAGNALASNATWSFTTQASPAQGPGGPILVVTSTANPFTTYPAEILRAEGLNAFATADITTVTAPMLTAYDVVILGEMALSPTQVTMFTTWVTNGGNLIALRPDKQLAGLLGLTDAGTTLANAYLLVTTASGPGAGIVPQTMQFHGTADRYVLNGATPVATLYSTATTATTNPAVTLRSVGTNGGQAAAFIYDLARSVVYTRQGNPAWAGQERDAADGVIRSDDLFFGNASFDPQPDWVDLTKVAIPQADEQQRLLANLILQMTTDRKPLPRFWYFPRNLEAVVVMTGDDHGNGGTLGRFTADLAASPAGCVVDNWECVRSTSYMYPSTPVTDAQAATFTAQGFEVGVHVTTNCANWTPASLESFFTDQIAAFAAQYPSLPAPHSNRTHCIAWSDWATQPVVELAHGIRLDANYYYWPGPWVQNRPGFFTGSGIPMRFAQVDGTLIDVYQATTQMTDESDQTYPFTIDTLLDRALGPEGYYGVFTVNAHTDSDSNPVRDAVVASAQARGIPVITAKQLLTWLDGRNASSFGGLTWNGTTLSFTVNVASGATGLQAMVPIAAGKTITSLTRNGSVVPYVVGTVKGLQYAFFPASAGPYQVTFAADTTSPTVTAVTPANNTTGVSLGTTVTATFSEAMDPSTITSTTVQLRDPTNTLVPATVTYNAPTNTAVLTPTVALTAGAVYTATVVGGTTDPRVKDLAGNALGTSVAWAFTTAPTAGCPCSVFSATALPGNASVADPSAVELGMKFQANIAGRITGIRFYKGATNTGTHVGNLWSSTGTLLGTVTFANETASGWQEAMLNTPVAIVANTTYVVSYHTSVGNYAGDNNYFGSPVVNGPLTAPADGAAGGNGVYLYGAGGFPTQTYNASNYWVDVVFGP